MKLQPVEYKIIYQSKNITKDVSDYLLGLTYKDKHAGESDEIELELHDKDLLWQNSWYPEKGSSISVQIIDGDAALDCGSFTVDENEYRSDRNGADVFSIRGLAAVVTKAIRTKKSTAHENKTLKELCNTIAAKHGLTVQGKISDIRISRITQYRQSDLSFLHKISEKYGYTFSIRDKLLIFTSLLDLVTKSHVLSIDKTECTSFTFTDKTKEVVKQATVNYHNPGKNKLITKTVTRDDVDRLVSVYTSTGAVDENLLAFNQPVSGELVSPDEFEPTDEAVMQDPVDDESLAEEVAKAKMIKSKIRETECTLTVPGNVLLITGNQVEITGFGRFSGVYYIIESEHKLDRQSGYQTTFTANKTGQVESKKHKAKKKKKVTDDYLAVEGPDYNENDNESDQE